ncbi:glycosyl transferase [Natranaerobius thermophilus]|uniref:Putative glycosyltransferase n=1 Tax=Natranaerobius thermophilus (strain ATCC BAA-1301 / DSM 18059 / JW/NM-WN-LF) TaxID=457570 RepID=B2A516_NATTJ|nr:glycosyl transferase [Natranaerobius thermophilus]ACB85258.1 putative glycosyltransferase [Natranaerobius thermophilus JW/NM-WN-LF]
MWTPFYWKLLGLFLTVLLVTRVSLIVFKDILINANLVTKNFRGKCIPGKMGIVFPIIIVPIAVILFIMGLDPLHILLMVFLLFSLAVMGLIDDFSLDQEKGLIGHIYLFLKKGSVSAGFLKALFGVKIGLLFSLIAAGEFYGPILLIDVMIISLSANLVNLLDVKPGRAAKWSLIWGIIFIVILDNNFELLIPLMAMLTAYAMGDIQEHYMMGDTGANPIGGYLGGIAVLSFTLEEKLIYFGFLLTIHILTEFYSLSTIIKKSIVLSFIDELGRK